MGSYAPKLPNSLLSPLFMETNSITLTNKQHHSGKSYSSIRLRTVIPASLRVITFIGGAAEGPSSSSKIRSIGEREPMIDFCLLVPSRRLDDRRIDFCRESRYDERELLPARHAHSPRPLVSSFFSSSRSRTMQSMSCRNAFSADCWLTGRCVACTTKGCCARSGCSSRKSMMAELGRSSSLSASSDDGEMLLCLTPCRLSHSTSSSERSMSSR